MEVLKKMRDGFAKIPQKLIYVIVIIACAYANIPSLVSTEDTFTALGLDYASLGMSMESMIVVTFILNVFVYWAILELAISIIVNLTGKRGHIIPEKIRLFKNTARLGYIFTSFIIGSYSMTEFITNEVLRLYFNYATDTVRMIVNCVVFTFVFLILKKDVIKEDRVFSFYYFLFRLYAIYLGVTTIFTLAMVLIPSDTEIVYAPADKLYAIINVVVFVVQIVLLYLFVYKKAKKEQIESMARMQAEIGRDDSDNDIFTGYGL